MVLPPNTTTQLSHALAIRANNQTVGTIHEWNPRQTRTITELYEFGQITPGTGGVQPGGPGEPYEKVPGNVSGMEIAVSRYDVYTTQMEAAFGTPDLTMLSRQFDPFQVVEGWISPNNANDYQNLYQGCWFSDLGRTFDAKGDRVVNVSATLHYTRKTANPARQRAVPGGGA
jgi:hypothetical protein